ncbi:hypothetical protein ACQPWY_32975 [Pseudonocardia xinjiangensis]|uniref:hypothetical protein n=1 Tax=Pseudonocardia xinjiangensis TaxID=75289 RepID=UPI003D8BF3EB
MSSELRLHPDRLRSHAVTAAGLSEDLRAALWFGPGPVGGRALTAEHERLGAAVLVAVRELAELSAALADAASAATSADDAVAVILRRIQDGLSGEEHA